MVVYGEKFELQQGVPHRGAEARSPVPDRSCPEGQAAGREVGLQKAKASQEQGDGHPGHNTQI
ncbi:hypothetical protein E2C01_028313 [Portunus trituberculatus]|uniref:Uncharacterized protein n=1 Tax=Portunus trituberculatus TaxID=210409 RepID=A0A5B7ENZ5_PORTR|nr:hypothetical protein [Portunus trituberculatus]